MEIKRVPIVSLTQDPGNVRRHGKRNLEAIKASLARWGQQKPLVVDADGIVRAGNGTLEAARQLGWADILIVRSGLGGVDLEAYAIADNRSAELASWSEDLGGVLERVVGDGVDLDALGFSEAELRSLLEPLPPKEFPIRDESLPTEYRCPRCSFEWSGSRKPAGEDV